MKKKLVFLGDTNSINIELVAKTHIKLKNKIKFILIGNIQELQRGLRKISSPLALNKIISPFDFQKYEKNKLNILDIENVSNEKYLNLLNQIKIANFLANKLNMDLVTLPINKSLFKKKINFTGMTEYLAQINQKKTKMLMYGEKVSVIPLTTHINLRDVKKSIKKDNLNSNISNILKQINRKIYKLDFKEIKFICYNPHCGEGNTLGNEDKLISETLSNFKKVSGPYAADSAFKKLNNKILFISMYHDQALIPFKILNKKGFNLTLGLNYRRISPAHGTAVDIKYKNIADTSSYISCMEY